MRLFLTVVLTLLLQLQQRRVTHHVSRDELKGLVVPPAAFSARAGLSYANPAPRLQIRQVRASAALAIERSRVFVAAAVEVENAGELPRVRLFRPAAYSSGKD